MTTYSPALGAAGSSRPAAPAPAPVPTPAPIPPAIAVGRAFGDIGAMVARELRRTIRSVDGLVTAFAIPVAIMLVFVVVFGGAIQSDGGYIDYVVPGVLILCLGFGSASTAVGVAQDMTSGTIDRFKTLPMFGPAVLFGHVIASVLRNLASCVPVVGIALLLGYRPAADALGWVAAVGFAALVIVAFTWLACAAGLFLSVDAAASISFVFLFLPYVSSGFVPVDTMPEWLRGFAENQPFTPIIESLRALLSGQPVGASLWEALAWLVGVLVVSYLAATLAYRRRTLS
ncbi:ABC transporter permease [Herbiconiux daphne]|uniref:Transport permease protein n=1 Tax=Herbiconiux daphne TaxID=2970914 RepID=A0ABT2H2F1_9MICO|nr:ABC transporter permease [Herbiconiux daphne]MCS5734066.1 ABC transporter permease [Herbiconiux daphne]